MMLPRMLVMFRNQDRFFHAVLWLERHQPVKGQALDDAPLFRIHYLYSSTDGKVSYATAPPEDVRCISRVKHSRTTVEQFEEYLRARLTKWGGTPAQVYDLLDVPKPEVVVEVSDEKRADLEELYRRAAKAMELTVTELHTRYGHLNPGLQAMNLRNRLRSLGQAV